MNFAKRFKGTIIAIGILAIVLAISFYYHNRQDVKTDVQVNEFVNEIFTEETVESAKTEEIIEFVNEDAPVETTVNKEIETDEIIMPNSLEPLESSVSGAETESQEEPSEKSMLSCFLAVRCDTLLDNMDSIAPEKIHLIPESGAILPETKFEFSKGESAFDVLERELTRHKIHFEVTNVPMYDSVYIEGIGNLYEFDAGNLSGWIYRVNGEVLSVGCSQYKLKDGDKIEFLYTCNMGKDL